MRKEVKDFLNKIASLGHEYCVWSHSMYRTLKLEVSDISQKITVYNGCLSRDISKSKGGWLSGSGDYYTHKNTIHENGSDIHTLYRSTS